MRPRHIARGMLDQDRHQPHRFRAQVFAQQLVAGRSLVAFVEQKVDRSEHAIEAFVKLRPARDLERDSRLANPLLRPRQLLLDRRLAAEKGPRDLARAESAQHLQREHDLRVSGERRMAAHEQQPQRVVANLRGTIARRRQIRKPLLDVHDHAGLLRARHPAVPHRVARQIHGHLRDPRRRVRRNSPDRPGAHRPQQRFLRHVLRQREIFDPKPADQCAVQPARFVAEEMLDQL